MTSTQLVQDAMEPFTTQSGAQPPPTAIQTHTAQPAFIGLSQAEKRVRTKHSLPAVPGPLRGSWPLASIRTAWTDRMLVPDSSHNLFDSYLREKAEVGGAPYQKDEQVEEATGKDGETEQNNPSELAGDNGQPVQGDQEEPDDEENTGKQAAKQSTRNKKCFNMTCNNGKIYKRIKSKIETSKYRSLCKVCHSNYSNNQFCEFCEQIYDNTVGDDQQDWIGCDGCERWNHVKCEMKHRKKDADKIKHEALSYECLSCSAKLKIKKQADPSFNVNNKRYRPKPSEDDPYHYDKPTFKKKTVRQIINQQKDEVYVNSQPVYVDIFNCPRENFNLLETFVNSINQAFKLQIPDDKIRADLGLVRRRLEKKEVDSLEEEDDPKKMKRRKK